ncbi:MAG: hypothetical protein JRE40_02020 [Deltaproteobacteria bacterium]|nr:hypothetical protein [Deltaproteobacteria bacterium]MBW2672528.1 hypothetical protein [Deltaproteobacteria bacterium]
MAQSNKQKAFKLFDQGKSPTDPEVKALKLTHPTRWQYFKEWKKRQSSEDSKVNSSEGSSQRTTLEGSEEGPHAEELEGKGESPQKLPQKSLRNPSEIPQKSSVEGKGGLVWKCLSCGAIAPADGKNYMEMIKHECPAGNRAIRLVDTGTGEELATNIGQAQAMGLIPRKKKEVPKPKPKEKQALKLETRLPGGESMGGIEETDEVPGQAERTEGVSQDFIEGAAIWIKAKVNVKTLMYYQAAADKVRKQGNGEIPLGDFIDVVTEDYFKARGLTLHLG